MHANQHVLDRRKLLQLAGLGSTAWMTRVADVLAQEAESAPRGKPAKSIILLWLAGGPSQLETFDPHPGKDIAGGTKAIGTSVREVQLAAGFDQLAERMEHVSLVRSLVSKEGDHERGTYNLMTGYRPDPTVLHPSLGAIACHQLSDSGVEIPRHVSILNTPWPARGGYLGPQHDAFQIGDPRGPLPDVKARVLGKRLERRNENLNVVESAFARGRTRAASATRHVETVKAAQTMMTSEQLKAFDIEEEPADLKRRYGDSPFGRGCLVARRLIEQGVRCVQVTLRGWDSHANNHETHTELVAMLDPAFATLIDDLRDRELLEETVVLCGGEFGRTPKINGLGGRDHWPHNFSFALAGGGIRGGRIVGQTDPEGTEKVVEAQQVADLHATVLKALGIDYAKEIITPISRPLRLSDGEPIEKLLV
ncbi:MAG: DUF1501 domain-containing protein [Planctomycetales bacterium]|nr:DUF1501 domain-containing protein [Planctomycetales bacterium]